MAGARDESALWRSRLRWRLAGATAGPAFVLLTLVETVLLMRLPFSGEEGSDLIPSFLAAGFANLALVGFCGPVGAALLRRRRPAAMPVGVWRDKIATVALVAVAALVLLGGILHRGVITRAQDDYDGQLTAVRNYLSFEAPPQYRSEIGREDVWKQAPGLYRTCVPGVDVLHAYCLIVDTGNGATTITVDPDQQPNQRVAGVDNPGRSGG